MSQQIKHKTSLSCIHCAREYKNNTSLNKHVILCELLTRKNNSENETLIIPSQKIMYQMILELTRKYKQLEDKIQYTNMQTKKIKMNVMDWLTENHKPTLVFPNINIEIQNSDINLLFESSLIEVFNVIFKRITDLHNIPIFAFAQKKNTFYYYENERWLEMSRVDFIRLFGDIRIKMSKYLLLWKQEHQDEIYNCDKTAQLYDSTNLKLMKYDFNNQSATGRIKTALFSSIKRTIKPIIEYDIEF
jgi:hypothetical protein